MATSVQRVARGTVILLLGLAWLAPAVRAHFCIIGEVELSPGQCVRDLLTIEADDFTEPDQSVYMVGGVNATLAEVTPAMLTGRDGIFTFCAKPKAPAGMTSAAIAWSYPPTGAANTCPVTIRVRRVGAGGNGESAGSGGDPVNTHTGELFEAFVADLELDGPLPLSFSRFYSSAFESDGLGSGRLGTNWRHNHEWRLIESGSRVEIIDGTGRLLVFLRNGHGEYIQNLRTDVPFQLVRGVTEFLLADTLAQMIYTFDASGKLTRVQDTRGNEHVLSYDGDELTQVSDGLGRTLTFSYTGGMLTGVSDGTRNLTFQQSGGNLVAVINARGLQTTFAYDAPGRLTSTTRPESNTTYTQVYDAAGRVMLQTDALGKETTFVYDTATETTQITDPLGETTSHGHSGGGELESFEDEAGQSIGRTYDLEGRVESVTDRDGDMLSYTYDPATGQLTQVVNPDGGTTTMTYVDRAAGPFVFQDLQSVTHADSTTESFGYDAVGNLTSWTDRAGEEWLYAYNARGQVTSATNPEGGVTTYAYDDAGMLDSVTDHAGNIVTFQYDEVFRRTRTDLPDTNAVTQTYDANDNVLSATNEDDRTVTFAYDDNDNLVSVTNALDHVTGYAYDALDRWISTTDPLGNTFSRTIDELGRTETLTDRRGNTTLLHYDALSRVTEVTDPAGKIWMRGYTPEGAESSFTDPLGKTWTFDVDAMGKLEALTNPLLQVRRLTRDLMGRRTTITDPLDFVTTIAYDDRGLIESITEAEGQLTTYARNALGQITTVTDANGQPWARGYDPQGRLISEMDPLGRSLSYTYDSRNRMMTVTMPLGTLTFTYDGRGNVTRESYSDGTVLDYVYDDLSRLVGGTDVALGYDANHEITSSNGLTMIRDAAGRIETLVLAPGKSVGYEYDAVGRLTRVVDWVGGETLLTYDDAGRLTSVQRPNGVDTTYAYFDDGRLANIDETALASIALTRDARGQVTGAIRNGYVATSAVPAPGAWPVDAASQVDGLTYDDHGRLVDDGAREYGYDLASRLRTINESGEIATFVYDALGQRISRSVGGETETHVWNYGFELPSVSVVRAQGADRIYLIHTPEGMLLHQIDASDRRRFLHFDEAGNTVLVTDDTGQRIAGYAYAPFGVQLNPDALNADRFTFQGRFGVWREDRRDLYYMRARYYDAALGRFLTPDPHSDDTPRGINPYQYALGNPIRYGDPEGGDENDGKSPRADKAPDPNAALRGGENALDRTGNDANVRRSDSCDTPRPRDRALDKTRPSNDVRKRPLLTLPDIVIVEETLEPDRFVPKREVRRVPVGYTSVRDDDPPPVVRPARGRGQLRRGAEGEVRVTIYATTSMQYIARFGPGLAAEQGISAPERPHKPTKRKAAKRRPTRKKAARR